ncbi:MAG: hypothetical protein SVP52_05100, partial [Chloroflexota bacterium]|nr:hypothetical protein [Chloroflexota bacterium]
LISEAYFYLTLNPFPKRKGLKGRGQGVGRIQIFQLLDDRLLIFIPDANLSLISEALFLPNPKSLP